VDNNQVAVFSLALISLIVFAVLVVFKSMQGKNRTQALQVLAQQIGFTFKGEVWNNQPKNHRFGTPLFGKGRSPVFENVMVGTSAGLETSLFDYSYTVSSGKSSRTYTQTVAAYSQELWLPEFELRPEGFLDRIGEAFVHNDIDFESHPNFSQRFLLRGREVDTIRELFSPALLTFLENLPADEEWHIEGRVNNLVLYRSDETMATEGFRSFLERTSSIAKIFFSAPAGLSKPVR
jgi:hypothetical protein